MITLDDNPPTCTMSYAELNDGETSPHHIHPWEHEVYIPQGSGTLFCDGKEFPIKEGDGFLIPPNVDHYMLNNGGQGIMARVEVNPLVATQSGGAQNNGGVGTGDPPAIRNRRDLDQSTGSRLVGTKDGAPTYFMIHNVMQPGGAAHEDTGGHTHAWEHVAFILSGNGILHFGGKDYPVTEGDAVLVPPNVHHQWRNNSSAPITRITFNPLAAEGGNG
jgi:quercetin dioxygenase-like cupin family protein